METVKSWVFSFCTTAVVATLVHMMVPKGNMEKILKITVRMFLISALVSPLIVNADLDITDDISFDFQTEYYTEMFREETNRLIEQELSKQVESMIVEALAEIDIYPEKVEVFIISPDEKTAEIEEVKIELNQHYKIRDTDIRYKISRIVESTISVNYTEDNGFEGES